MRLAPPEHSAIRSRRLLALLALFTTLPLIVWSVDYPAWWTERGLIKLDEISGIPVPADDYAVLNQGQLKALATAAFEEIQTRLAPIGGIGNLTAPSLDDDDNVIQPGGTGWRLQYLVGGFTQNENYAAVNLGQLKATAKPFYDRLIELGFVTPKDDPLSIRRPALRRALVPPPDVREFFIPPSLPQLHQHETE